MESTVSLPQSRKVKNMKSTRIFVYLAFLIVCIPRDGSTALFKQDMPPLPHKTAGGDLESEVKFRQPGMTEDELIEKTFVEPSPKQKRKKDSLANPCEEGFTILSIGDKRHRNYKCKQADMGCEKPEWHNECVESGRSSIGNGSRVIATGCQCRGS